MLLVALAAPLTPCSQVRGLCCAWVAPARPVDLRALRLAHHDGREEEGCEEAEEEAGAAARCLRLPSTSAQLTSSRWFDFQASSDDGSLFYHEGTKGFVGDQVNTFVYQIGLAS